MERKEYQKPRIIHQEELEAAAGACAQGAPPGLNGKAPATQCTWANS